MENSENHIEEMVLGLLADSGPSAIPGEVVSGKLGIDPSEVFRRIDSLRSKGYRIDSLVGGYRLVSVPDRVGPMEIGVFLDTTEVGRSIHYRDSLPSTNDVAFRLAREGAFHGDVVVAEEQTMGRGRCGRQWISPKGKNIYFSVILRPDLPAARSPELTFVGAVAMADAIEDIYGLKPGIKWPNDIILSGRKLAGLLPELLADGDRIGFVVLGGGVNVNMVESDMPSSIASIATSIAIELGAGVDRHRLLAQLFSSLEDWYYRWLDEGFEPVRRRWMESSVTLGKMVEVEESSGIRKKGEAVDMWPNGGLVLRMLDGEEVVINSGEVVSASLVPAPDE